MLSRSCEPKLLHLLSTHFIDDETRQVCVAAYFPQHLSRDSCPPSHNDFISLMPYIPFPSIQKASHLLFVQNAAALNPSQRPKHLTPQSHSFIHSLRRLSHNPPLTTRLLSLQSQSISPITPNPISSPSPPKQTPQIT